MWQTKSLKSIATRTFRSQYIVFYFQIIKEKPVTGLMTDFNSKHEGEDFKDFFFF